jgi:hypothetical protein
MWSVFEYLSMIPAPADRLGMLRELQRYRGPRPDRPRAPVFRADWYAKHRDRILATLIERFENETDASPLLPRRAYRETG